MLEIGKDFHRRTAGVGGSSVDTHVARFVRSHIAQGEAMNVKRFCENCCAIISTKKRKTHNEYLHVLSDSLNSYSK